MLTQWLSKLGAVTAGKNLAVCTHISWSKPRVTPAPGDLIPFLASEAICIHIYIYDFLKLENLFKMNLSGDWRVSSVKSICFSRGPEFGSQHSTHVGCGSQALVTLPPRGPMTSSASADAHTQETHTQTHTQLIKIKSKCLS